MALREEASVEYLQAFLALHEWVERPLRDGRKGYWRRKPYTRRTPTIAQLRVRLQLAEAALSATDETGTRLITGRDGKVKTVVPAAQRVQEVMTGQKFVEEKPRTLPFYIPVPVNLEEARRRLKELLAS